MAFEKPQSRNEAILQNMLGAKNVLEPPKSRIEALLQEILETGGGGGGGTNNYEHLTNLPQINSTELKGNMRLGLSVTAGKVKFYEEVQS